MKSARERMDMYAAYQEVGSYSAAAQICGTTPKTVTRAMAKARAAHGATSVTEPLVEHNYDEVADLIAERVAKTQGRISAKQLLACYARRRLRRLGTQPAPSGGRGQGLLAACMETIGGVPKTLLTDRMGA